MTRKGIAICWGLKEDAYSCSPFLPELGQPLPSSIQDLEELVSSIHTTYGSEISFYWCFPLWALAQKLRPLMIDVAGLASFDAAARKPNLIILIDLPTSRSTFDALVKRFVNTPIVLVVAETPLERQAQHTPSNFKLFKSVLTYNQGLAKYADNIVHYELPFKLYWPPKTLFGQYRLPVNRFYICSYVGNAHSSGWRRNFQYQLGWRGFPIVWQYLQGWQVRLTALFLDEYFGAYKIREAIVLAANDLLKDELLLSGRGWGSGGTGWLNRFFLIPRFKLKTCNIPNTPGSKVSSLANSIFTIACENYLGERGYISEKLYDAMAAGCIPIYVGTPNSLPTELEGIVLDLSALPRSSLKSRRCLSRILSDIFSMTDDEIRDRHLRCLQFMENEFGQYSKITEFCNKVAAIYHEACE